MGTPTFAVPALQYLLDAGYNIVGVITAPDKPGGRGMNKLISSPVKDFAEKNNLPLFQPVNLKSSAFLEVLRGLKADLQVVVAFRMLPEVVWNMPVHGTLNLHGSLLPAYRGAAPLQRAIMNGDKITGVTTFLLEHEIDSGKILLQREIPILDDDDTGSLHDRMMYAGAALVVATVDQVCKGEHHPKSQDLSRVSHAPKIHQEDACIQWTMPTVSIINLIRSMSPFPGAWTTLDDTPLKIWKARAVVAAQRGIPGTLCIQDHEMLVKTGDGEIELMEIQLAGKRRMTGREFLNGYRIKKLFLT